VQHGAAIPEAYMDIVQQPLYEVGHQWASHRIAVAEHHLDRAAASRL
jgi:hypothetical protein